MCKNICTTLFGVAIVLVLANLAGATVINVDLQGTNGDRGAYSGQGAYANVGNNYWNHVSCGAGSPDSIPATALSDSTDTATAVTFAVPYCYANTSPVTLNPDALLGDNIACAGAYIPATFTIGGLTPGSTWFMYLYAVNVQTSGAVLRVGVFLRRWRHISLLSHWSIG